MTLSLSRVPPGITYKHLLSKLQSVTCHQGTKLKMEDWPHLDGGGTVTCGVKEKRGGQFLGDFFCLQSPVCTLF